MVAFGALLVKLIHSRRHQPQSFPLIAFISGLAFFNTLDLIHAKHLIYFLFPLLLYSVITGGTYLKAAATLMTTASL